MLTETGSEGLEDLENFAEERSKSYRLFSFFLLKRPDEEFLKKIKSDQFVDNIEKIFRHGEWEFKEPISHIKNYIEETRNERDDHVLEGLQVDFTKLTRGIKKGYGPPPPYESVWRGSSIVWSEWAQKVVRFYAETGIGMDLEGELPEHLGIELKFMSLLCWREKSLWEDGDTDGAISTLKREGEFLRNHLLKWAPRYLEKMALEANTGFYRGIALLTKNFLEHDIQTIDELTNPLL